MIRLFVLAAACCGLAACSSGPPIEFYTLDSVPPAIAPAISTAVTLPLVVSVNVPEVLDRPELVRTAGPDRLDVSGIHRWGAPIDDLIRRALAQDLAQRLPGRAIFAEPPPGSQSNETLVVSIDTFTPDQNGVVTLDGHWTLVSQSSDLAKTMGAARVTIDATAPTFPASAQAMSKALAAFADKIVAEGVD